MKKNLFIFLCVLVALISCQSTKIEKSQQGDEYTKVIDGAQKVEVLAMHRTIAQFKAIEYRLCKGLTVLCPKDCGESGEFAVFQIIEYTDYEKSGEYGDEKQDEFLIHLTDYYKKTLNNSFESTIMGLRPNDTVILNWDHLYITKDSAQYPERPVIEIKKMS